MPWPGLAASVSRPDDRMEAKQVGEWAPGREMRASGRVGEMTRPSQSEPARMLSNQFRSRLGEPAGTTTRYSPIFIDLIIISTVADLPVQHLEFVQAGVMQHARATMLAKVPCDVRGGRLILQIGAREGR